MGRRQRRFVDKKHSETYHLVYKSTEDDDFLSEERILVGQGLDELHPQSTAGGYRNRIAHDLFPVDGDDLTEHEVEEIKDLGLPSDGYNYLRHLRSLRHTRAQFPVDSKNQSILIESDHFIEPEAEKRIVHAKGLTIHSEAGDEKEADGSEKSRAVRAFSRVVPSVKGSTAIEIEEVDAWVDKFEQMHVVEGDLLDSFVLDATQSKELPLHRGDDRRIALPEDLSSEEEECIQGGQRDTGDGKSVGRSRFSRGDHDIDSQSSFSDRWKGMDPTDFEGRRERTRPLEIIDEMFENVLGQYDEDQVGELTDDIDDGMHLEELSKYLNGGDYKPGSGFYVESVQGAQSQKTKKPPKRMGPYKLLKKVSRTASLAERDPKAIEKTKRLAQSRIGSKREEWEDVLIAVKSEKAVDCETAWSMRTRSTLHQPAQIVSISKRRFQPANISTEPVKISSKSGLPVEHGDEISENESEETATSEAGHVPGSDDVSSQQRYRSETTEERRRRKHSVKEAQKQARIKKKQTKTLFTKETIRQQRQAACSLTKNASVVTL